MHSHQHARVNAEESTVGTTCAASQAAESLSSTGIMQHDEQVRLTKELIAHLDAGTNVDAGGLIPQSTSTYTDAGQAAREWREWFRGMPLCIGMSGDLADSGAFLTTEDLGTPMLATRDTEGVFRASVNSCLPRGALVRRRRAAPGGG